MKNSPIVDDREYDVLKNDILKLRANILILKAKTHLLKS